MANKRRMQIDLLILQRGKESKQIVEGAADEQKREKQGKDADGPLFGHSLLGHFDLMVIVFHGGIILSVVN
jgi:hypothetical protein